jgi:hypothetical protein
VSAELVPAPSDARWDCPTCRRHNDEEYCPRCGEQRRCEGDLGFGHVWRQVVRETFDVDGRFFGTIRLLLTRPGQLTLDFLEGRRVGHVHPLKLFLLVSAIYFLLSGGPMMRIGWSDTGTSQRVAGTQLLRRPSPRVEELLRRKAEHRGISYEAFQRKIEGDLEILMKAGVVAGVVANGFWLAFLFRRQRRYLAEHMVMALHVSCFAMAVTVLVQQGQRLLSVGPSRGSGLIAVAVLLYFVTAARRVYGTHGRRLAVAGVLMLLTGIVVLVAAVGLYLWHLLY